MNLQDKIYNYPTRNKIGFLMVEVEQLLSEFPDCNREKFNSALLGITCLGDENWNVIIFHSDIEKALYCGLENRNLRSYEWD
jgi:hypothetical protein